jgi:hypothetical protein
MEPKKPVKKTTNIIVRAPQDLHKMIKKLSKKTNLTQNAICLDILREGVTEKLKELDKK